MVIAKYDRIADSYSVPLSVSIRALCIAAHRRLFRACCQVFRKCVPVSYLLKYLSLPSSAKYLNSPTHASIEQ